MTLSPFEVERREFGRGPVGYRTKEVDAFIDEVYRALAGLWEERAGLRETNERLEERVARFTQLEEQLKNTLLLAQDSADKATEQARRESELMLREAGQKAREIVHGAHDERQRLETSLRELQSAEIEARQRFRQLGESVMRILDDSEVDTQQAAATLRAIVQPTGELPSVRADGVATVPGGEVGGTGFGERAAGAEARRVARDEQRRAAATAEREAAEATIQREPMFEPPPRFDDRRFVRRADGTPDGEEAVTTT